ncbi:MAG: Holliday junction resolvase RuvX [Planctomycetia bacterium]|nr:Holliday junction resolvase RuvX [Planctomycetia bacterium]
MTETDTKRPGKIPGQGRVAGIDFGTVRIGLAITDRERLIASPYEIYTRRSERLDADYFRRFVEQERIVGFVLGLPLHCDGRISSKAEEAFRFAEWLRTLTGLETEFMDERYTSVLAHEYLREAKMTQKQRKARIDKIAAQIILATWLERGCTGTTEYEALDD